MATLTNPKVINNAVPSPYGRGVATIVEGYFPASSAGIAQPVGNLSKNDLVEIVQLQPQTGAQGFCYDRAGSNFNAAGLGAVSVVPMQGGNSPATPVFIQIRVFRNC